MQLPKGRKAINNVSRFSRSSVMKMEKSNDIKHLVVKSCRQKKDFDYDETYALVARITTVRILLSMIVNENFYADQLDVKNAFLHGKLKRERYIYIYETIRRL